MKCPRNSKLYQSLGLQNILLQLDFQSNAPMKQFNFIKNTKTSPRLKLQLTMIDSYESSMMLMILPKRPQLHEIRCRYKRKYL